jgi:hypothetical protein
MDMIYLTLICVVLVLLLAFEQWDRARERREHAEQIAALCQRIQAPALAVTAHDAATREMVVQPQPPAWDDDAAWHQTKDQLAEGLP